MIELGNVNIYIGDGNYSSKYPRASEFINEGIPFISASDFSGRIFDEKGMKYISEELHGTLLKGHLKERDILVVVRGNGCGKVGFVPEEYEDANINAQLALLRCDNVSVNSEFLYYLLSTTEYQYKLKALSSGSAQPQLTISSLKKLQLDLPEYQYQLKIAKIAKAIDDKILVNTAINRNLWDQIDAWFYRLYTSDDAVRIMFGDVVTRCSERVKDDVVKVLSPVSTGEIVLSEDFFTKQVYSKDIGKYLKVNPYDFCYNPARANIGSIGMNDYDFTGCVSPVYVVFKTKNILKYYMSRYIRTDNFKAEVITRSSGSVRQALRYEDLVQIEFRKPNDYALEEFNEFYLGLKMKIESIKKENARLNDLRDCMLPRLMSGELDVSDLDIL